jgi:precorrin-2 dehydrogenase/sirohydrochlorin ferrochelatase
MLDVVGRLAVIIGSTPAAVRAASSLAKHGADVVIVTPDVSTELMDMESAGTLSIEPRGYVRGDLAGAMLVVIASGSEETDAAIVSEAREHNVLVNVQTDAASSDFIVPSVVRRGDLQVAVSTAGKAPSVARQVRRSIARAHGEEWGPYVQLVADLRALAVARTGASEAELAPLFSFVEDSDVLYRLHAGEKVTAEELYASYAASRGEASSEGSGS